MKVILHTANFDRDMKNFLDYSMGFLEGIEDGKPAFFKEFARGTIAGLNKYIDSTARMNQQAMHHVYEWYKTGSPEARLFKITSLENANGIQIRSTFTQSKTLAKNSKQIFANKASVMENGMPIHISPKKGVLAFEVDGETVFTRKEITIANPGGPSVAGSYQKAFDSFFQNYFSQSFLRASGILNYLDDISVYKTHLAAGVKSGKGIGKSAGYKWIVNAKIGVE